MSGFNRVRFGKTEDAYEGFAPLLMEIIRTTSCKSILDVGGGAQPQLTPADLALWKIDYTVMDISESELALAPDHYRKIVMDISGTLSEKMPRFDLVFSRFVAEHVRDARKLHENVFSLLRPGGLAVHFFPTLWALPFVANWALPERLSVKLLSKERQARGKFAAYYHWCVGPTERAIERLENVGFEVVEYAGFFGHGYYDRFPSLRKVHGAVRSWLLRHPIAQCTSFAWVILRKPAGVRAGREGA
jgi:SAM-dependent methyltransferase